MKMNDDIKLVNNLYYLGSIVTIMDYPESENNDKRYYNTHTIGEIYSLRINDNISINAAFGQLGPDMFSISDYEIDQLFVQIIKNGEIAGLLNFHSTFNNSEYIGINTPKFSNELKLRRIEKMKPNTFERVQMVLRKFHALNSEDIEAINKKSEEIKNWAIEMINENTNKFSK